MEHLSRRFGVGRCAGAGIRRTALLAAATSVAAALDLAVDDAIVLHDSNRLTLRLLPCDVLARVAPAGHRTAPFEVELAQRLAETDCPVAALEPRVEPRVYERDGFDVTLWTYEAPTPAAGLTGRLRPRPRAAARGHADARRHDAALHGSSRGGARHRRAGRPQSCARRTPTGSSSAARCDDRRRAIDIRAPGEQLLHGEPHPGNVLSTRKGPLFVDLETCCRGPVEFDLAHVPEAVSERYPNADQDVLSQCRGLVLAMVAAWRWDRDDRLPNGQRAARDLLDALREGPPWPALTTVMPPA